MSGVGRRLGLCVALTLPLVACSGSSGRSSTAASRLPPPTFADLAPIFDPQVNPLGLRLTRGALVTADERRPSATGTHLALYVEPIAQWSAARHVEAIVPLARALVPDAFARWPGLESVDVCQEPSPGTDDRAVPTPVSTVDTTREASAAIDWDTAKLVTLVAATTRRTGFRLTVSTAVDEDPSLRSAFDEAEAMVASGR